MSNSTLVRMGAAAAGVGAVVGLAVYAESLQNAEEHNIGYQATDRVVACAEMLGQKTMNMVDVKANCPTETFAVTGQVNGTDGTHTVTVKYPTSASYLSAAYEPAKQLDRQATTEYRWKTASEMVVYGALGAAAGGMCVLLAEAMYARDKRQKEEKAAAEAPKPTHL